MVTFILLGILLNLIIFVASIIKDYEKTFEVFNENPTIFLLFYLIPYFAFVVFFVAFVYYKIIRG